MPNTLRSCIVAEQGYTFISIDASQIELRVLAILSQDPRMLEDLKTGDLHQATAIRMLGEPTREEALGHLEDPEVTTEMIDKWLKDEMKRRRYIAKQANFALVYGADEIKLAEMLDCPVEEATQFMVEHKNTYPVLYQWIEATKKKAKEDGFVVNLFGRIRPIPELSSGNWRLREKAERECVNTIVQGSAVDIVKKMMLYMRGILDRSIRLVLQVHDEMVLEVPDTLLQDALEKSKELYLAFPDYPVGIMVGKCYGELEEVKNEA